MAKLFEYAIIFHPKTVRDGQGNETQGPAEILVQPTFVLAKSDKDVGIRAAREIPQKYMDLLDQVEVCVRPF
jgi:hypothetical protein